MTKAIPFIFFSTLLVGCASQNPELVGADGELLPAPVRESSILAPVEEEEVFLATEVELLEPQAVEVSDDFDGQEIEEPAASVEQGVPQPSPQVVQSTTTTEIPEAPEIDTPNTKLGEGAVAGAASALLNTGTALDGQNILAGDAKGESDVAAYLLDEAQNSFERENYEKARGQSERALTLEPTAARAYLILARIDIINGQPDQAAEMARRGLASTSDSDEVFEQLNQVLAEVEDMQPMPIPQIIEEVQESAPNSSGPIIPL